MGLKLFTEHAWDGSPYERSPVKGRRRQYTNTSCILIKEQTTSSWTIEERFPKEAHLHFGIHRHTTCGPGAIRKTNRFPRSYIYDIMMDLDLFGIHMHKHYIPIRSDSHHDRRAYLQIIYIILCD